MQTIALWITITLLLSHELDAVARREWRLLPLLSHLPENTARQLFIWAHVPLILLLLWIAQSGADTMAAKLFSGFAILHVALHRLYRNHPANDFDNPTSRLLIWLPALTGASHLALS